MVSRIRKFFNEGHARSLNARKQILFSFFLKGVNIIIGFVYVPLMLAFVGEVKYGLWLTIGSVISWFSFLDIGLGNGLRNHLAEAFAKEDRLLAKTLVSSAYSAVTFVSICALGIFSIVNFFLDWDSILRAPDSIEIDLGLIVWLVFSMFCLQLIFKLIGTVLTAGQRPSLNTAIITCGNLVAVSLLLSLVWFSVEGSLLMVAILQSVPIVLVLILASLYFYFADYSDIKPSLKFFDKSKVKGLVGLGAKFFLLQIGQIVIYTTDNLIITRILGPEEVTTYFVPQKYFSLIILGFSIIMTPLWSAFTEAKAQNDFVWIRSTLKRLMQIWVGFFVLAGVLLMMSPIVYKLWVGQEVAHKITFSLSLLTAVFVCLSSFASIFLNFLNGFGKVSLQTLAIIVAAGINIPLSYYFGKSLGMGSTGVILASVVSISFFVVLMPLQSYKILGGKAKGIWNR